MNSMKVLVDLYIVLAKEKVSMVIIFILLITSLYNQHLIKKEIAIVKTQTKENQIEELQEELMSVGFQLDSMKLKYDYNFYTK